FRARVARAIPGASASPRARKVGSAPVRLGRKEIRVSNPGGKWRPILALSAIALGAAPRAVAVDATEPAASSVVSKEQFQGIPIAAHGDDTLFGSVNVQGRGSWMGGKYDFSGPAFAGAANTSIDGKFDFSVPIARVNLSGNLSYSWLAYNLGVDFGSDPQFGGQLAPPLSGSSYTTLASGQGHLTDTYLAFHPCRENYLQVGQFKVPLGVGSSSSEHDTPFIGRSSSTSLLNPPRDI